MRTPSVVSATQFLVTGVLALFSCVVYISSLGNVLFNEFNYPWAPYYPNHLLSWLFIIVQLLLQAYWLAQLPFRTGPSHRHLRQRELSGQDSGTVLLSAVDEEDIFPLASEAFHTFDPDPSQLAYIPFYVLGNILMAAWGVFWLSGKLILSQIILSANAAVQIAALFYLFRSSRPHSLSRGNVMTHLVAKTSLGLAVLHMWKNWGAVEDTAAPTIAEMFQSGIVFLLLTICSGPDPILGICLLCDLLALFLGQNTKNSSSTWRLVFFYFGVAVSAAIFLDQIAALRRGTAWIKNDMSRRPVERVIGVEGEDGVEDMSMFPLPLSSSADGTTRASSR